MKNKIDWNALRDEAYKMACDHGFHDKERSAEEAIELIHCELAEATESLRKGEANHWIADGGKPEGFYVELVDAIIRILDFMGERQIQDATPESDPYTTVLSPMELMKQVRWHLCNCAIWSGHSGGMFIRHLRHALFHLVHFLELNKEDVEALIREKMAYNETREYKHGKAF